MIHGIDNFAHPVRNLEKAVEFYRDVLRLDLHFVAREAGWAEFDVGGVTLALREMKSGFLPSRSSICFLVTDLDEEVQSLKEKGVQFPVGITEIAGGHGRCIWFQDPDGNRLDFYEPPE